MTLQDILRAKGTVVHAISSSASLQDVVQKLVRHNCGSLVVCESEEQPPTSMLGIITERDILRACAARRLPLTELSVDEVMTSEVITCSPNDLVEEVMGLMTDKRIRHLPVVDNGRLVGLVSIGDIVKAQHDRLSMENHYLKSYIHG